MQAKGVASLPELRDISPESEVKFIAWQMTVDLLEFKTSQFIKNIESGGAPTINNFAGASDVCPFICGRNE